MDMEAAATRLKVGHIRGLEKRLGCSLSDLTESGSSATDAGGDQIMFAAFIIQMDADGAADFDTLWQRAEDMSLADIEAAVGGQEETADDPQIPAGGGTSS